MITRCPSCSRPGSERSNPQAEVWEGEPVSRNASELDSASLRYVGVTNLPDMAKSVTVDEATPECNQRAPRGGWRQRAGKEEHRNLRGPVVETHHRASDDLIVVMKPGNSGGAKGVSCKHVLIGSNMDGLIHSDPLPSLNVLIVINTQICDKMNRSGAKATGNHVYGRATASAAYNRLISVLTDELTGEPDAGNPHVRFDEGE